MRKLSFSGYAATLAVGAVVLFAGVMMPTGPAAAQCTMYCPCSVVTCPPGTNSFTRAFDNFFETAAYYSGAKKADTKKKKTAKRAKSKKKS